MSIRYTDKIRIKFSSSNYSVHFVFSPVGNQLKVLVCGGEHVSEGARIYREIRPCGSVNCTTQKKARTATGHL